MNAAQFDWHPWFAWKPVTAPGPRPDTRALLWMETVERRATLVGREMVWEYRDTR